jgi:hypothetical protein
MVEWRGRQVAHVWLTDWLTPEPKNTTGIVTEQRTEFKKCPLCSRDWRSPIFLIFSLLSFCLLICQFVQKDTHCYCFPSPCMEILSLLSVLGTALTNLKSNNNITATTACWLVCTGTDCKTSGEEVVKLFCRKYVQTHSLAQRSVTNCADTHTPRQHRYRLI